MLKYLQSLFGVEINVTDWLLPPNTPFYLRDGYSFRKLIWDNQSCLFAKPKDSATRLPTLKKQYGIITSLSDCPCALELEGLTSQQRRNLMDDHIPFVAPPYQAYLPFWGCVFTEKYKDVIVPEDTMPPMTQLIFLHLFYTLNGERTTASEIRKSLGLAKVTVARAIDYLVASRLFTETIGNKPKWITAATDKQDLLIEGMKRMKSPVEKRVFITSLPVNTPTLLGGVRALSRVSMVGANESDGSVVIYKKDFKSVPKEYVIDESVYNDFGGSIVEVWRYNPRLLTKTLAVDDISLLLSLSKETDERIQMGLDDIRRKYGLPSEA